MTVNIVSVLVRECLAKQTVTLQFFPVGGDCIALGRSPPSYIGELVDEVLEDGQAPEFHQLVDLGDLETMLQIPLEGWCAGTLMSTSANPKKLPSSIHWSSSNSLTGCSSPSFQLSLQGEPTFLLLYLTCQTARHRSSIL